MMLQEKNQQSGVVSVTPDKAQLLDLSAFLEYNKCIVFSGSLMHHQISVWIMGHISGLALA